MQRGLQMTSSNTNTSHGGASVLRRMLARFARPPVFISMLAVLLIFAVAACGDDDGTPSASDSASPTNSLSATGSTSPSGDGDILPTPNATGLGTATIDGVQYDFAVTTCSIGPELVLVIGFGTDPDGQPLVGAASWNELDFISGVPDAFEVGIGVNAPSLLDVGDKVYKLGSVVLGSTVESIDINVTAFDLTASGLFVDLEDPEAPAVPGTFTVSCSEF